ncbi:MAG TPA: hypothetical protein VOA88_21005 [Candidatus Dormibacteraeota bacterium]|nr:hypothetical protein [Candidatus Dormibacteraeota bacterium]
MQCPSCGKDVPGESPFCNHCGKPTSVKTRSQAGIKATWLFIGFGLAVAVLLFVLRQEPPKVAVGSVQRTTDAPAVEPVSVPDPTPAPPPVPVFVPVTQKLFSGQLTVMKGGYVQQRIIIDTARMSNVRITGQFTASGGTGNDIQVVIAEESEYTNWINGHPAQALYSTGKITTGSFDVPITQSGIYYLAFSNKFSVFTDKSLFVESQLSYAAH